MRNQGRQPPTAAETIQMQVFREQHPCEDGADHIDNKVGRPQRELAVVQSRTQPLLGGQCHGNPRQVSRQNSIAKLFWFHGRYLSLSSCIFSCLSFFVFPALALAYLALRSYPGRQVGE